MSFKIRFNLGRGENYQKWRITDNTSGKSFYLDPNGVCLTLVKCTLTNQKSAANKIHQGSNKTVCAWINCEDILAGSAMDIEGDIVKYNPREIPSWIYKGEIADEKVFDQLFTNGRSILCKK